MAVYKVFITQIRTSTSNIDENLGTSMLCETFVDFEKAKSEGLRHLLFPNSYFDIKEYDDDEKILLFGANDKGKLIYSYRKALG